MEIPRIFLVFLFMFGSFIEGFVSKGENWVKADDYDR